eukprot:749813-Hanusia_phi.AAC.1
MGGGRGGDATEADDMGAGDVHDGDEEERPGEVPRAAFVKSVCSEAAGEEQRPLGADRVLVEASGGCGSLRRRYEEARRRGEEETGSRGVCM